MQRVVYCGGGPEANSLERPVQAPSKTVFPLPSLAPCLYLHCARIKHPHQVTFISSAAKPPTEVIKLNDPRTLDHRTLAE